VFQNALKESFAAKILSCRIPVKNLRSRRHLLLDPITVKQTFLNLEDDLWKCRLNALDRNTGVLQKLQIGGKGRHRRKRS
jgi:hypothetical protein